MMLGKSRIAGKLDGWQDSGMAGRSWMTGESLIWNGYVGKN